MRRRFIILSIPMLLLPLTFQSGFANVSTKEHRLPELIVNSRRKNANVMHIVGVVREYSYLQTHFDTVFMFRDKTVDFMIPLPSVKKFVGWKTARVLSSESYYQFFDYNGLDSVSDRYYTNFSIGNRLSLPSSISTDGLKINDDNLAVSIDILNNEFPDKWQPGATSFLKSNKNIDQFDVRFCFENVEGLSLILPIYISSVIYTLQSIGPLSGMRAPVMASKSFQINTRSELYVTDREFITVQEARKYQKELSSVIENCAFSTPELPDIPVEIKNLIARVKAIDHRKLRLREVPDSLTKGFYYSHPPRLINFRNWIRGMVGLPALARKLSK